MHFEAHQFFSILKMNFYNHFKNAKVLEVGSYTVNHSIRDCFIECEYTGLDLIEGPGVDIIDDGAKFILNRVFDTVISAECFEHNPRYQDTFNNMVKHCRSGGLIAFSCASYGRAEHGTTRTSPAESPGTISVGWDYYKNLRETDFDLEYINSNFSSHLFIENKVSSDLYFVGFKKSNEETTIPSLDRVQTLIASISECSILLNEFWKFKNARVPEKAFFVTSQIFSLMEHSISPMLLNYVHSYFIELKNYNENTISSHIKHLLHHYPDSVFTAHLLGIYLYQKKLYHASIGSLHQAIASNSTFTPSYWALGRTYYANKEYEKSIKNYENALLIDPNALWIKPYITNAKKALEN